MLLEVLSGPYSRSFAPTLGPSGVALVGALLDRQRDRIVHDELTLDMVDLAAVRDLGPMLIERYDESDWFLVAGRSLADVRALLERAVAARREYSTPKGSVRCGVGACDVDFPARYLSQGVYAVAIPDRNSWKRVVPACAKGLRPDFLALLASRYAPNGKNRLLIEGRVADFRELDGLLRPA